MLKKSYQNETFLIICGSSIDDDSAHLLAWKGESQPTFARGGVGAATVEIFVSRQDGLWERRSLRHVQRHHPPDAIRTALAAAGLECVVAGQHPGARLEDGFDDERHIKLVYFARHASACRPGGT